AVVAAIVAAIIAAIIAAVVAAIIAAVAAIIAAIIAAVVVPTDVFSVIIVAAIRIVGWVRHRCRWKIRQHRSKTRTSQRGSRKDVLEIGPALQIAQHAGLDDTT
ncbi:MAG: hypothetical protein AB3N21_10475, partial [Ruegeria sp.]|uniref:hypothetical protein n=1 Tax=Ruegeria sp. TaxID=1879320 RepID=UPI00349EB221